MSGGLNRLAEGYAAALRDFLSDEGEAALRRAYELGRAAIGEGVGVLEMARVHEGTVLELLREADAGEAARIVEGALPFLMESLAPYEMTHRGFREANAELRRLNDTLEEQVAERTAEAEARRTEAEEANRAKSEFLAVMSHELRTPLNAIMGYADLLLMGVPSRLAEGSRKQVDRVRASAQHLLQLIDEVLTFSRAEAGREQVHREVVDLADLVRETAELIEPLAEEKGLRFHVRTAAAGPSIETDPGKVRQILLNLLSNAVKFTEQGEVELEARVGGDEVILRVRDTGIGIPPEEAERIFDPFWQVDRGASRRRGGTGLGLSVSRRLAELLGGELSVESAPGRGSLFTVRLPVGGGGNADRAAQ